jgi:hypothetical protein
MVEDIVALAIILFESMGAPVTVCAILWSIVLAALVVYAFGKTALVFPLRWKSLVRHRLFPSLSH